MMWNCLFSARLYFPFVRSFVSAFALFVVMDFPFKLGLFTFDLDSFILWLFAFLFHLVFSFLPLSLPTTRVCVCMMCVCAISGYCLLVICIKTYYHCLLCAYMLDHCSHTTRFFFLLTLFVPFFFFLRNFKLLASFYLVCHSFRDRVVMFVISYECFFFFGIVF